MSTKRPPRSDKRRPVDLAACQITARRHEQDTARVLPGKLTPGSGSLGQPGDIDTILFLVECKYHSGRAIEIRLDVLEKIDREARAAGKTPLLALRFPDVKGGTPRDWVLGPIALAVSAIKAASRQADSATALKE